MFSIIIVDYRTPQKTYEYIRELIEKSRYSDEMNFIIVDNSDCGEVREYFQGNTIKNRGVLTVDQDKQYEWESYACFDTKNTNLYVITAQENLGYGRGNNIGAIFSEEYLHDEFLVVSNNDLHPVGELNWQSIIHFFYAHRNCAMMGPLIVDKRTKKSISPIKKASAWKELFLYYIDCITHHLLINKYCQFSGGERKTVQCDALNGAFVIADKEKFFKFGMYDKNTFLYYEELIIGEKVKKSGYESWFFYSSDFHLIHDHAATVKKNICPLENDKISFRSRIYYFTKYRKLKRIYVGLAYAFFYLFYMPIAYFKLFVKNTLKHSYMG